MTKKKSLVQQFCIWSATPWPRSHTEYLVDVCGFQQQLIQDSGIFLNQWVIRSELRIVVTCHLSFLQQLGPPPCRVLLLTPTVAGVSGLSHLSEQLREVSMQISGCRLHTNIWNWLNILHYSLHSLYYIRSVIMVVSIKYHPDNDHWFIIRTSVVSVKGQIVLPFSIV